MDSERLGFHGLLHRVEQLSNPELSQQLRQLNLQNCVRDAELLLYLSELDQRGLYREEAVSSLFEFCVSRLGCSEDVAYKRVGAARLMRRFPLVFDLLCAGRIHLSALMLVKPLLTEDNHREWLRAASGKSKRQVEMLVARRCPKPEVATSVRKLPEPRTSPDGERSRRATPSPIATAPLDEPFAAAPLDEPLAATPAAQFSAVQAAPVVQGSAVQTAPVAQGTVAQTPAADERTSTVPPRGEAAEPPRPFVPLSDHANHRAVAPSAVPAHAVPPAQVKPLSGSSYRVTFTASGRLKEKLDQARELASHVISPSDLPGLLERAVDLLIEREERRRCAFGVKARATTKLHRVVTDDADTEGQISTEGKEDNRSRAESESHVDHMQQACPMQRNGSATAQDPGRKAASKAGDRPVRDGTDRPLQPTKSRSRHVPAAVRREIWKRDAGRCTFTDAQGNRCTERRFLEIEHLMPYALNGATSVENCTLRCRCHNRLTAEWVFGRRKIDSAMAQARKQRR